MEQGRDREKEKPWLYLKLLFIGICTYIHRQIDTFTENEHHVNVGMCYYLVFVLPGSRNVASIEHWVVSQVKGVKH